MATAIWVSWLRREKDGSGARNDRFLPKSRLTATAATNSHFFLIKNANQPDKEKVKNKGIKAIQ